MPSQQQSAPSRPGRSTLRAAVPTCLGWIVMVVVGLRASRYTGGLDPDQPCRVWQLCDPAANAAALRDLWWWWLAGLALAVGGVVLAVRGRSGIPPLVTSLDPPRWRLPALAAATTWGAMAVAAPVALMGMFVSLHLGATVLVATWLGVTWLLDRVHARADPTARVVLGPVAPGSAPLGSDRGRLVHALLVSAVALVATSAAVAWRAGSGDGPDVLLLAWLGPGIAVGLLTAQDRAAWPRLSWYAPRTGAHG